MRSIFKTILCLMLACFMVGACFIGCEKADEGDADKPADPPADPDGGKDDAGGGADDGEGEEEEVDKWDEDTPRRSKTYEFLFIGNSYTGNAGGVHTKFSEMATSADYRLNVDSVIQGARNLEEHFANSKAAEGERVDEKLNSKSYDYVIIQEQSHRPITNFESFYRGAKALVEKVRFNGATPILYCTWARHTLSPEYENDITNFPGSGELIVNNEVMTYKLAAAYAAVGAALDVEVVYVGFAFQDIHNNTDIEIYNTKDYYHQNTKGAYLSALTLCCDIFNIKAEEITYDMELSADELAKFKAAADKAAFDAPEIPAEYTVTIPE